MQTTDNINNEHPKVIHKTTYGAIGLGITWRNDSEPSSENALNVSTSTIGENSSREIEEIRERAYKEGYMEGYRDGLDKAYSVAKDSFECGADELYAMGKDHQKQLVDKKKFFLENYAEGIISEEPPKKRIKCEYSDLTEELIMDD